MHNHHDPACMYRQPCPSTVKRILIHVYAPNWKLWTEIPQTLPIRPQPPQSGRHGQQHSYPNRLQPQRPYLLTGTQETSQRHWTPKYYIQICWDRSSQRQNAGTIPNLLHSRHSIQSHWGHTQRIKPREVEADHRSFISPRPKCKLWDSPTSSLTYIRVDKVANKAAQRGKGEQWSTSHAETYRMVPVHSNDKHLLGVNWNG